MCRTGCLASAGTLDSSFDSSVCSLQEQLSGMRMKVTAGKTQKEQAVGNPAVTGPGTMEARGTWTHLRGAAMKKTVSNIDCLIEYKFLKGRYEDNFFKICILFKMLGQQMSTWLFSGKSNSRGHSNCVGLDA